MRFDGRIAVAGGLALLVVIVGLYFLTRGSSNAARQPAASAAASETLELSDTQLAAVQVAPAPERVFAVEKEAFGNIDFNEDMEVQVFTPYQGRIINAYPKLGDEVKRGEVLFTIESPDLIQAESNLIGAAGVLELTSKALARAKELYAVQGIAQKDLEQAVSDEQTAEGVLKAARDAVRVFGKTDAEMDHMVKSRAVDRELVVPSPITGRVTSRNAAPGLLVQPGNPPPPYVVADLSTVWMVANVAESDSSAFHVGQEVKVSVMAYPGRIFQGKISRVAIAIDPNIHRLVVRSEVTDPNHELRPGMFASFVIQTAAPITAVAVPLDGVVREGDGTMTIWVATDHHHFTRRTVELGLQENGYDQIVQGLKPGEMIATKGAVFLSNMLNGGES